MTRTLDGKPFSEFTKDELELRLLVELASIDWHHMADPIDPEAIDSYGTGRDGGKHTIHILSKYEDGEIVLAAINDNMSDWKRSGADPFKLQWLWEQVSNE